MTNAASLTATVQAWNKASLSGDVTAAMSAEFIATARSMGKVMADHSAVLTISGLPACTVNTITLYVRSNQSSGAGLVMITLADQAWLVANGDFNQWPGISGYSTTSQPLIGLNDAIDVVKGTQLTLLMEGTNNSIYIEKMVVDYTLAPPTLHTLTLQWYSNDGINHTYQISESEVGAGIDLPAIETQDSLINNKGETWSWIGWCRQNIGVENTPPIYWGKDDWYYMDDDYTLYALYTNLSEQTIRQDSTFTSGEYALVYVVNGTNDKLALAGSWQSGKIAMMPVSISMDEQGEWYWNVSSLDSVYRYQLDFVSDSVAIFHPKSKSWIGHTKSSVSKGYSQWIWHKVGHGSIVLYDHLVSNSASWEASCLSIMFDTDTYSFNGSYQTDLFAEDALYWHLFPTASVPTQADAYYTTFGDVSAFSEVSDTQKSTCKKWIDQQGRIVILFNNQKFNILGEIL